MNKLNSRIMQLVVGLILVLCPVSSWAITGDVDGDGVVTASDITAIYNYLLNNDETFLATSDVDGDGVVTAVDVTLIYNIILNDDYTGVVNADQNGDGHITSSDVTAVYNILLGGSKKK